MKVKKISIALILCMSIVFCDIYTVRANILTSITSFCNLFHKLENGEINNLLDFIDQAFSNSGLIGPKIPGDLQSLEDFIHSEYPSLEGQTSEDTQENISDYLITNITVNDNDSTYTFNDNSRNFFIALADYYRDNNQYYQMYSLDLQYYNLPQDILDFVNQYQDQGVFLSPRPNNGFTAVVTDSELPNYGYVYQSTDTTKSYICKLYDYTTFNPYGRFDVGWNAAFPTGTIIKKYVNSSGDFVTVTNRDGGFNMGFNSFILMKDEFSYRETDYPLPNLVNTSQAILVSYGKQIEKLVYGNFSMFSSASRGCAPYYYNNQTWNSFTSSSGDYTVDNSNVNTVTYGDVVSYVNDYHDTNNNYPNQQNIGTWIENQNNDNTGGGSGGGGSGGGGSGGGSGNTGIFDFLSEIGQVLGNLIKNLGKVLTDLISSISEIISDLFEVIPTVFGDFLSGLFGWLPEDLRALIILGISAMIIVGLVKLIRG